MKNFLKIKFLLIASLFMLMACSKNQQEMRKAANDRNKIALSFDQEANTNLADTIHLTDSIIGASQNLNLTCNLVIKQGVFEFEKLMFQIEDSLKIILTTDSNGNPLTYNISTKTSDWKKTSIDFIDPFSDKLFIPVRFSLAKGIGYYNLKFKAFSYKNLDSTEVISKRIYIRM
jgi:hypothetical protein